MKIAFYYDIVTGGAKRSVYEFARNLKAMNHQIDLYAPSSDNFFLVADKFAENRYDFNYKPILDLGEQTFLFSPLIWLELPKLLSFSKSLAAIIDQRGYDAVFVHNSMYTQCPVLLRYLRTPSIYYCHEPFRFVTEPHPLLKGAREIARKLVLFLTKPVQKLLFALESSNLRKAGMVLTNSCFTMENLYRYYGICSFPCYQGVDTKQFRPTRIKKENILLSVGQLNRWKGQEFLVKSLALIPKDQRPALQLVYNKSAAGYKKHIDKLANRLNVRIFHSENIEEEELVRQYNRAKLLVYAPIMEPFGFAPIEAMACETPVVAVKEGGVRETVIHDKTGLLTLRDPQDFARKVMLLLSSMELCEKLGRNGRRHVLEYWTWATSAVSLEKYIVRIRGKYASDADRN